MIRAALALLGVVAAAWPAAAGASTASVSEEYRQPELPASDPAGVYARVEYAAAPGEANDVTVRALAPLDALGLPRSIEVRDAGATIVPGAGCAAVDQHTVRCESPSGGHLEGVVVDAGDGDDRVLFGGGETAPHARLGQRASGGPGDDRIEASDGPFGLSGDAGADVLAGGSGRGTVTGGSGGDRLAGGAGDDVLVGDGPGAGAADDVIDGRGGSDTVSYAERADAVRVDLAAGAGGASGERDAVAGVEDVRGGSGGGVLLGDDGPNTLRAGGSRRANSYVIAGRGGDDVIFGSAAADRLSGGDGGDRIAGGDGDDLIRAGAGADRIVASDAARADCGSGHDTADLGEGVQAAACERVELEAADVSVPTLMRSGRALRLRVAPQGAACAVRVLVLEGNRTYPPVRDADAGEPYSNLGRTSFALAHPQRAALTVRLNALGRRSLARKPRRLLRLALVPSRRCSRGPIGARELEANTFLFRLAPHS